MRVSVQYWEPVRLATRFRQLGPRRAIRELPRRSRTKVRAYMGAPRARLRLLDSSFELWDETYDLAVHSYGATWKTERAVEVALARAFLRALGGQSLLEIGNVVRHYDRTVPHDVVDKYDRRRGVINEDVVDFTPVTPYGALLSISTLEHVGWDEEPRQPDKLGRVLERLPSLVSPGAPVLVTMPLGYNPVVDDMVQTGAMPFAESAVLVRTAYQSWEQQPPAAVQGVRYGSPFPAANAIYVGRGLRPRSV